MVTFNELLREHMTDGQVLNMVAQSSEFESMMVREVGAWAHGCLSAWAHKAGST